MFNVTGSAMSDDCTIPSGYLKRVQDVAAAINGLVGSDRNPRPVIELQRYLTDICSNCEGQDNTQASLEYYEEAIRLYHLMQERNLMHMSSGYQGNQRLNRDNGDGRHANVMRLHRMFRNILRNAYKHSSHEDEVGTQSVTPLEVTRWLASDEYYTLIGGYPIVTRRALATMLYLKRTDRIKTLHYSVEDWMGMLGYDSNPYDSKLILDYEDTDAITDAKIRIINSIGNSSSWCRSMSRFLYAVPTIKKISGMMDPVFTTDRPGPSEEEKTSIIERLWLDYADWVECQSGDGFPMVDSGYVDDVMFMCSSLPSADERDGFLSKLRRSGLFDGEPDDGWDIVRMVFNDVRPVLSMFDKSPWSSITLIPSRNNVSSKINSMTHEIVYWFTKKTGRPPSIVTVLSFIQVLEACVKGQCMTAFGDSARMKDYELMFRMTHILMMAGYPTGFINECMMSVFSTEDAVIGSVTS